MATGGQIQHKNLQGHPLPEKQLNQREKKHIDKEATKRQKKKQTPAGSRGRYPNKRPCKKPNSQQVPSTY
jgi:hypothetical protein